MKSSLMEDAAALESGGMRQPAGGKAVDVENWISSDSIAKNDRPTIRRPDLDRRNCRFEH